MLGEYIMQTRRRRPLVHCITNYVTANDCANILLACGGSAVMADDPEEAAEITAACDGLTLNLGTPSPRRLEGIRLAGLEANRLSHPAVLDPVGAAGSAFRRNAAQRLLQEIRFAAIRGNADEIAALTRGAACGRGVDANGPHPSGADVACARALARETGAVVVVTGERDIVTDGETVLRVMNGHPMMRSVTGTGCQLSALLGAILTANPENPLMAALTAVCTMGLCGEIAHARLTDGEGNAAYRSRIIDAVFNLTPEMLEKGARYEVYR